jgi:hypothetical protein
MTSRAQVLLRAVVASGFAFGLSIPPCRQQQRGWTVDGVAHEEAVGKALARLPDRDGDGMTELLVGTPDRAVAQRLAGNDGRLLRE